MERIRDPSEGERMSEPEQARDLRQKSLSRGIGPGPRGCPDAGGAVAGVPESLLPVVHQILRELEDIRRMLDAKRKDLLTTKEVAHATGRSEYTIRRWIASGSLN